MFRYTNSKLVEHQIDKVLEVILDIKNYPKFLPWCKGARIKSRTNNQITADLIISFKAINVTYTSLVTIENSSSNNGAVCVKSSMIEGPFKYLDSCWELTKVGDDQTNVKFDIEFAFQSMILKKLMLPIFNHASVKILSSFEEYLNSMET